MSLEIRQYALDDFQEWNELVARSKNGVFFFNRRFMEYHSDRYRDCSLVAFNNNKLVAALPANIQGDELVSHGGLTYGGWIIDKEMTVLGMQEIFFATRDFLKLNGISTLRYKAIPSIFHVIPAQEDLYCLHQMGAVLVRRDVSTVLAMGFDKDYSNQRKRNIKKAIKNELIVEETHDYEGYFDVLSEALSFHAAAPVHSVSEITYLANEFPQNIKLFVAKLRGQIVAGSLVFISSNVVHTQYLAASSVGKNVGALDLVLDYLISEECNEKKYLSFGISTEEEGRYVNSGLIRQKEGFGGRASVNDFYLLKI